MLLKYHHLAELLHLLGHLCLRLYWTKGEFLALRGKWFHHRLHLHRSLSLVRLSLLTPLGIDQAFHLSFQDSCRLNHRYLLPLLCQATLLYAL